MFARAHCVASNFDVQKVAQIKCHERKSVAFLRLNPLALPNERANWSSMLMMTESGVRLVQTEPLLNTYLKQQILSNDNGIETCKISYNPRHTRQKIVRAHTHIQRHLLLECFGFVHAEALKQSLSLKFPENECVFDEMSVDLWIRVCCVCVCSGKGVFVYILA